MVHTGEKGEDNEFSRLENDIWPGLAGFLQISTDTGLLWETDWTGGLTRNEPGGTSIG